MILREMTALKFPAYTVLKEDNWIVYQKQMEIDFVVGGGNRPFRVAVDFPCWAERRERGIGQSQLWYFVGDSIRICSDRCT